jgi:hypothetical protein
MKWQQHGSPRGLLARRRSHPISSLRACTCYHVSCRTLESAVTVGNRRLGPVYSVCFRTQCARYCRWRRMRGGVRLFSLRPVPPAEEVWSMAARRVPYREACRKRRLLPLARLPSRCLQCGTTVGSPFAASAGGCAERVAIPRDAMYSGREKTLSSARGSGWASDSALLGRCGFRIRCEAGRDSDEDSATALLLPDRVVIRGAL